MKVLLFGPRLCRNLGGPSLLNSTIDVLKDKFEKIEFHYISPTSEDLEERDKFDFQIDYLESSYGRKLLPAALLKRLFHISLGPEDVKNVMDLMEDVDVLIDFRGIEFADTLNANSFQNRVLRRSHWITAKLFKLKVIKYTSDYGPFTETWNRIFAKWYLNRFVDLIFVRGETSQKLLSELGVKTPRYVFPDTAFLLKMESSDFSKKLLEYGKKQPVIGLSVSFMASRHSGDRYQYIKTMARFSDYMIEKYGARVVLIPNEFSEKISKDDLRIAQEIHYIINEQTNSELVDKDFPAKKMKGIIGELDILVAARYHSIIAGLSQGVPVLALGWHHKYHDVMKLVKQQDHVCSVFDYSVENLIKAFDRLWNQRLSSKEQITSRLPIIFDEVRRSGEILHEFLFGGVSSEEFF